MNVLIVGSSIAGPALAHFLAEAGANVTVIERAPALREGGYCVDVRGTALGVVERMGILPALRAHASNTASNAVVDSRGRVFGRTARGFGVIDPDDVEILRGDLVRILHDLTKSRVRYRFDTCISDLTPTELAHFDVIAGCDGVHSRTRAWAFGPESDFVHSLGSNMAIWSMPNFLGLDREQLLFQGMNQIASIKSTNDNERLYIGTFYRERGNEKKDVARAFANAGWEFPHLIEEMWRADDFYSDITCQIRMPSFTTRSTPTSQRANVALVGDAAYCPSPLSGQGTSLALAGAFVLARSLATQPVDEAFTTYNETMRDFVKQNQLIAERIGKGFAADSSLALRIRTFMMSLLPYLPGTELMMKLAMRPVRQAARALAL